MAVALAATSSTGESLPNSYAFRIVCTWQKSVGSDPARTEQTEENMTFASTPAPELLNGETPGGTYEVAGVAGVRHFVTAALPGALAGQLITVFPDGRSVWMQTYDVNNELSVFSEIGICEIFE